MELYSLNSSPDVGAQAQYGAARLDPQVVWR